MESSAVLIPFRPMSLGERIRAARKQAKLSQVALAELLGVTSQSVNQWESGRYSPSRDNITRLADALGVSVSVLLQPPVLQNESTTSSITPYVQLSLGGRKVPLVERGQVQAKDKYSVADSVVYTSFPCGPNAYAIVMWDASCAPAIPKGSRLIFDPDKVAIPGDFVLAAVDGEIVCGALRFETGPSGSVAVVQPLDDRWPAHREDCAQDFHIIAVKTEAHLSG